MLIRHRAMVSGAALISCLLLSNQCLADEPNIIINNNTTPAPTAPAQPAQNTNSNCMNQNAEGLRGGTYYQTNPNGGTDTIYTTGDKTPYNVDNSCNNNNNNATPIIQPYIYGPNLPHPPVHR